MTLNKKLTLTSKKSITGLLFVLPFYIGFIFFFLSPLIQSLIFAFSNVQVSLRGYQLNFVKLDNFNYILNNDVWFKQNMQSTFTDFSWQIAFILLASLFLALILKPKFHGRTFVRAIFFLPVIIATGYIINVIKGDTIARSMMEGNVITSGNVINSNALLDLLNQIGVNQSITKYFNVVYQSIFNLMWKTGIQMIIFLAGLQSIPPALYEASAIEGATAWDDFWKITIPMLIPIILVNTVYTIVDSFTDSSNTIMEEIMGNMSTLRLGWSSAMAWLYFLIIGAILAVVLFIFHLFSKNSLE